MRPGESEQEKDRAVALQQNPVSLASLALVMIRPVLRALHSPDLSEPQLPVDPARCSVLVQAIVGALDEAGEESFDFLVVTPQHLCDNPAPQWGRGLLLLPEFDWSVVRAFLAKRLAAAARPTWSEVATELGKEMHWEFENYGA